VKATEFRIVHTRRRHWNRFHRNFQSCPLRICKVSLITLCTLWRTNVHFLFKLPVIPALGCRSRCEKLHPVMQSKTNLDQGRKNKAFVKLLPCLSLLFNVMMTLRGFWQVLSPNRKETSSEECQGRTRFQQHRNASCYEALSPARQHAEGNSRHSDRNISLFPSWSA